MGRKGNSGYTNPDRTFATETSSSVGYSGSLGLTQHYLERLDSNLPPGEGPQPAPGMSVWTRADKLVTFDGSGKVNTWGDLSGNGNNWIPTSNGSKGPPDFDASNSFVNNLPTIDFASNECMDMNYSLSLGVENTGFTLYMVSKKNSYPNTWNMLICHTDSGAWDDGWGILQYTSGTTGKLQFWIRDWIDSNDGEQTSVLSAGIASGNANIYKMVFDNNRIYANIIGPDADSSISDITSFKANVPTDKGLQLNGGQGGSSNYTSNQDVAEVIYYKGTLTAAEILQTENYLKDRYGFT